MFAVCLTLIAMELLLRDVRVRDQLPPRMVYYHPAVSIRQDALDRTLLEHGRIDVLFIGSSIVRTNVQPLLFDHVLEAELEQPVISFNTGMLGMWPRGVLLYLERVWLPAVRPRVIVQGIRYPELRARTAALHEELFFNTVVERGWRESGLVDRVTSRATEQLRLLQYRGVLPVQLQRWIGGRPGVTEEEDHLMPIDARGYTPRLPTLPESLARGLVQDASSHEDRCEETGCDVGIEAIRLAQETAVRAGALYVLVDIPEFAGRWPGVEGRRRYEAYVSTLRTLAADSGIPFIDLTAGNPACFADEQEYSDYYHMSPLGSERFTRELARALGPIIRDHLRGAATGRGRPVGSTPACPMDE